MANREQTWDFNGWLVATEASDFLAASSAVPGKAFGKTDRGNPRAGFWREMWHTLVRCREGGIICSASRSECDSPANPLESNRWLKAFLCASVSL